MYAERAKEDAQKPGNQLALLLGSRGSHRLTGKLIAALYAHNSKRIALLRTVWAIACSSAHRSAALCANTCTLKQFITAVFAIHDPSPIPPLCIGIRILINARTCHRTVADSFRTKTATISQ